MNCPNCGAQNPDNALFCSNCSGRMDGTPQPVFDPQQQAYVWPQQQQNVQPPQPPYGQQYQQPYQQQPYGSQYQQPYGQNYQNYQQRYGNNAKPGSGAATTSLVCGIVGLFFLGIALGIIAIVQGNRAKKLGYPGGKATAGIVLGILDLVGFALYLVYVIWLASM